MGTYFCGGGSYLHQGNVHYVLSILERASHQQKLYPTTFLPHGIAFDPVNKNRLITTEKKGPGAVAITVSDAEASAQTFQAMPGHHFYGHCVFVQEGERLLTVESELATTEGAIAIRDSLSLDVIGLFPSFGDKPHDCVLTDDGKTLVVSNAGSKEKGSEGAISFIDISTQTLVKQIKVPSPLVNAGHIALGGNGDIALVSAPNDALTEDQEGGVSLGRNDRLTFVSDHLVAGTALEGETLSVVISDKYQLAITCTPRANRLCFWSLPTQSLIKAMKIDGPRGVALADEETALVTYGANSAWVEIDLASLQLKSKTYFSPTYITGSHLYEMPSA
ncbi:DUF1513 domain-containing protein [Leeia sp. TBRC 13508]|uniref:DUF1513 domain-containing protein n=1 Tax=Leeia speluncae TaxID=2884804 RepID=A0ABS8D5S5_9NEIS|nr:DUF1513 domain-containing protein [Leeia speluncae]MCB6183555.1 DUF1513 domain-containing protein [Leeia speluncae]